MSEASKWSALVALTLEDANDPELRRLAACLKDACAIAGGGVHAPWRFCCLALTVARDWVLYQTDTARVGTEDIAGFTRPREPALAVLTENRKDDCDAKARLFVALCRAAGVPAELVPVWRDGALAHVFARAYCLAPSERRPDWHAAETILARARLGEPAATVPPERDTKAWKYT